MKPVDIKRELIRRGSGKAIELLETMSKLNPERFAKWLKTGGTIELRKIAAPYKNYSIYDQRNDRLPFFNDVCEIDSVWLKLHDKEVSL